MSVELTKWWWRLLARRRERGLRRERGRAVTLAAAGFWPAEEEDAAARWARAYEERIRAERGERRRALGERQRRRSRAALYVLMLREAMDCDTGQYLEDPRDWYIIAGCP